MTFDASPSSSAHELAAATAALRRQGAIAAHMAEAVAMIAAGDGRLVWVNGAWERMFGYEPGELIGVHISAVNAGTEEDPQRTAETIIETLRRDGVWHGEVHNVRKDGSTLWCQANVSSFDDDEYGPVWIAVHTEVTARVHAEAALRASEARFRRVFEGNPVGMALVDADARFVDVNDALLAMLDYDRTDLIGHPFSDVTPEEDAHRDVDLTAQMFAGAIHGFHLEKRYVTRHGRVKWGALQATLVDPEPDGSAAAGGAVADRYAVVIIEDITTRKEAEARLAHLATHDELTGLPNRSLAIDRMAHAQARTERTGEQIALLYLDIDGLKAVNNRLGHDTGDLVLIETAGRVQSVLRRADTAARMGSDEFVVWCEDLGSDPEAARAEAIAIAGRVREAVARPIHLHDREVQLTASIGIVLTAGTERPIGALLRDADIAMERAKARGGNHAEVFTAQM